MDVFNKGESTKTPGCAKCGDQIKNQTPFCQHVMSTHNAEHHIQQRFMIAVRKATNINSDLRDTGGYGQVSSKETGLLGKPQYWAL